MKYTRILLFMHIGLAFYLPALGAGYQSDSLAVRAILDSAGMAHVPVEYVTRRDSLTGRIDGLFIEKQKEHPPLPGEPYYELKVMETIIPAVGDLSELQNLTLTFHNLKALPSSISKLKKLKVINLDINDFTKIPEVIFDLDDLISLSFVSTPVEIIPPELYKFSNMYILNFRNTNLKQIAPGIGVLQKLRFLDLTNNKLEELPPDIVSLFHDTLELWEYYLDVSINSLCSVPADIAAWLDRYTPPSGWRDLQYIWGADERRLCEVMAVTPKESSKTGEVSFKYDASDGLVKYSLPEGESAIGLRVLDLDGKNVNGLEKPSNGQFRLTGLGSGLYIFALKTDKRSITRKLLLH